MDANAPQTLYVTGFFILNSGYNHFYDLGQLDQDENSCWKKPSHPYPYLPSGTMQIRPTQICKRGNRWAITLDDYGFTPMMAQKLGNDQTSPVGNYGGGVRVRDHPRTWLEWASDYFTWIGCVVGAGILIYAHDDPLFYSYLCLCS